MGLQRGHEIKVPILHIGVFKLALKVSTYSGNLFVSCNVVNHNAMGYLL